MSIASVISRGVGPGSSIGLFITGGYAIATSAAALTGSLADGVLESEVARTWQELYITLESDTFLTLTASRKQEIIDGITSSGTETGGWNNQVRDKVQTPSVTRLSSTVVKVHFEGFPAYSVSANETITVTVPASVCSSGSAVTATPTILVTANAAGGTEIVNTQSTTSVPNNYELDDRTGFRLLPGEIERDGYGQYTRSKSVDQRHPQDRVRSRGGDKQRGSVSPESSDTFLTNGEVSASDL